MPVPNDLSRPFDVLHIGQPKCASTWLQRVALNDHPQIALSWRDCKKQLYRFFEYGFDEDPDRFAAELEGARSQTGERGAARVLSNESFCGEMFTGAGARLIADLTHRALGPVKCFFVVREPYAFIYSIWNQYVQEGGVLSLKRFLQSPLSPAWSGVLGRSSLWERCRHIEAIDYWTSLMGRENIGVFLMEDLLGDADSFACELYRFIGVDEGIRPAAERVRGSFPHGLARLVCPVNRLMKSIHNPGGLLPNRVHVAFRRGCTRLAQRRVWRGGRPDVRALASQEESRSIADANRRLGEYLGRNLDPLGYAAGPKKTSAS